MVKAVVLAVRVGGWVMRTAVDIAVAGQVKRIILVVVVVKITELW